MPLEPPATRTRSIVASREAIPWIFSQSANGSEHRLGRTPASRAATVTPSMRMPSHLVKRMPTPFASCSMRTRRIITRGESMHSIAAAPRLLHAKPTLSITAPGCCRITMGVLRAVSVQGTPASWLELIAACSSNSCGVARAPMVLFNLDTSTDTTAYKAETAAVTEVEERAADYATPQA